MFSFPRFAILIKVSRAVARFEIPGGLVVLGGDNVSPPLVKIGLADLLNIGGAKVPSPHLATALQQYNYLSTLLTFMKSSA